jgi:hypothetical protein
MDTGSAVQQHFERHHASAEAEIENPLCAAPAGHRLQ